MKRLRMFLAPLALLLVGAAVTADPGGAAASGGGSPVPAVASALHGQPLVADWHPPVWRQVRIEQHSSIRITPGTAAMPPAMVEELEQEERVEHLGQRKFGKCLGINTIAAVQSGDGDELLLFLHDQRIISVKLEKRCSARDFYSGFYIIRHADGAMCTGRDILQSRSGANCKIRRLMELVPSGYRRFP